MNPTRPKEGDSTLRRTILFSGRVQGVGFRYTARRIAASFRVTGTVRNLDDGRVELIAEGEPAEIDRFRDALLREFQGHIAGAESADSPATSEFPGFQIQR
jgi:acylphosphatase